jgi:hypothetical protein
MQAQLVIGQRLPYEGALAEKLRWAERGGKVGLARYNLSEHPPFRKDRELSLQSEGSS